MSFVCSQLVQLLKDKFYVIFYHLSCCKKCTYDDVDHTHDVNNKVHVGSTMVVEGRGHGIELMNQRQILHLILRSTTQIHPRFGKKLLSFWSSTSCNKVQKKFRRKSSIVDGEKWKKIINR
jgi:hypothetical protein